MRVNADDATLEPMTAAWKLFNTPVRVAIPGKFFYSPEYLKHKGINSTSHNDAVSVLESMINTCLSPQRIAELYMEGANIDFLEANGGEVVYRIVTEHINDWYKIVHETMVDVTPPINDLFTLDDVARKLHPFVAQRELDKMRNTGVGTGALRGQSFFRLGNLRSAELTTSNAKPYKSLISAIINRVGANRGTN